VASSSARLRTLKKHTDALPGARVDPVGRQFGERTEHEQSITEPWMRDDEARLVHARLAVQDQIQIQGPGRARPWPLPAERALDLEQAVQHRAGRQVGTADGHTIQEPRLIADADRRGLDPGRMPEVGEEFAEAADAEGERRLAVADVAAERDGDAGGRATPPSGCPAPTLSGR